MIILKFIVNTLGREDVEWIYLAEDRNKWSAVLNTVMK
jgi:hypothetical protein